MQTKHVYICTARL